MRSLPTVLAVLLLFFCASCPQQVPNPADCTYDDSVCTSAGLACDPRLHQCVAVEGCLSAAMCSAPTASTCSNNKCSACAADAECSDWSTLRNATPARPFCIHLGQQSSCAQCRPGNGATDCTDPLNPICDATLGLCRPCRADKDCPSRLCRKLGDHPDVPPVPGLQVGQCVPSSQISYVNQENTACLKSGTTSSPEQPFCDVGVAIAANKPYISVAPSKLFYPDINFNQPGATFIVVGPAADTRSFSYFDRITVAAGTLVLANLYLAPLSSGTGEVTCSGSQSSLYLSTSTMLNLGKYKIHLIDASMDCGQLTVDRMLIDCGGASSAGVVIGGTGAVTTQFHVVNNGIEVCGGSAGEQYAVMINSQASGYFGFNNLFGNYKGIQCAASTQSVVNSVVAGNTMSQIDGCAFDPAYNITDENKIDIPSPPFLEANTTLTNMYVIDKGLPPPSDHPVPIDYDGNPRPQGQGYDIGLQELN